LVHGAPFTADERAIADQYGHATVDDAIELATRAGAGRLVLTHHGPTRSDDAVEDLGRSARRDFDSLSVAKEGCSLEV
jgi:ribonuclease BN (tRNA processing enzyme)